MEKSNGQSGIVFNIQHYCIHDGPGIRTNVFLKGCPLNCLWCQNPESNQIQPQIMYEISKCDGCGACVSACEQLAITLENGHVKTNRSLCNGCGKCVEVCLNEARTLMGKAYAVRQVMEDVTQDKLFYRKSGGGVTLTGGEVLYQYAFALNILKECKNEGLHTAIETCGYSRWEVLSKVLEYTDLVLFDIKHMISENHMLCTGVKNDLILSNLKKASVDMKKDIIIRVPVIPNYNDSKENFHMLGSFIVENVPTCLEVNLLPYHAMGEGKRDQLEESRSKFKSHSPSQETMEDYLSIIRSYGITAK
ncbi:MAG: glycyl-radical enzyme activating protein [Youngiibacter sp.]|nr:glycyl-radical enzyme activating protein [Youngiibacter sp.]